MDRAEVVKNGSNDLAARERDAFKALEKAWERTGVSDEDWVVGLHRAVDAFLAARRDAEDAGYIPVLVSRESREKLYHTTFEGQPAGTDYYIMCEIACRSLVRDLADVLKRR